MQFVLNTFDCETYLFFDFVLGKMNFNFVVHFAFNHVFNLFVLVFALVGKAYKIKFRNICWIYCGFFMELVPLLKVVDLKLKVLDIDIERDGVHYVGWVGVNALIKSVALA